jgi:hypothetical protein
MSIEVTRTGPLFDGRAEAAARDIVNEMEDEVAELGVDLVRVRLSRVLKNPTGYYRSKVTAIDGRVTDQRVVYGPWLEGTGSRNKKTKFKGYHTFRLTRQELDSKVPDVADRVVPKHLEKMR